MAGLNLNLTDMVAANGQYTMTFASDGSWKLTLGDAIARIAEQQLPITDITAQYSGGVPLINWFANTLIVSFTWTQSGWSVQQVVQNIEAALDNGVMGHYTYIQGVGGYTQSTILDQIKILLGSETGSGVQSSYWWWIPIGLLIFIVIGATIFTKDFAHLAAKNAGKRL